MTQSLDKFSKARIVERKDFAADLWMVRIAPEGPVNFVAGQYATLAVEHNGKKYWVCCTGCRDLFRDDPEGVLEEYRQRKAAEAARRRFQEGVIEQHRLTARRFEPKAHVPYQNLLSSVLENAQLAALEITYGVDVSRMPEILESVRASVSRTADVLQHLVWHSHRTSKRDS